MRRDRQGLKSKHADDRFLRQQRGRQKKNELFYANQILEFFHEKTPDIIEVNEFLERNLIDHETVLEELMAKANPDKESRKKYNKLKNIGSAFTMLVLITLLLSSLAHGAVAAKIEDGSPIDLAKLNRQIDKMNVNIPPPSHLYGLSTSNPEAKEFLSQKARKQAELKSLFKDIAESDSEHAMVIQACVENVNTFGLLDLKKDREFLLKNDYIQKKSGGRTLYRGPVSEGKNAVTLVDQLNDLESLRLVITHECLHVLQHSRDIKYSLADERELDECVIGLRELLDKVVGCFNGDSELCDEVEAYSKNFRNQIVLDDCPDPKFKIDDAYSLSRFSNSKVSWKKSLLMKFEPVEGTNKVCLKYAFGLEDKSGKRILFSDEARDLAHMAVVLNNIKSREQIVASYKQEDVHSHVTNIELHANIFDKVPTKILDTVCKPHLVGRLKGGIDKKKDGSEL